MGHRVDFEDLNSEFTLRLLHPPDQSLTDDLPPDIAIGLFIIASFVTSYRCFARYTKKLWGWDDTAALLSLFFFIFFVIGSYNICSQCGVRQIAVLIFRDP